MAPSARGSAGGAARRACAPTPAALAPLVAAALRPGDAVLVKGSLGSRMKLVVQAIDARDDGGGLMLYNLFAPLGRSSSSSSTCSAT